MPISILMPALSPTMTEGNLVKWLKKEGDTVKAGEVMAEIETDKATMEVEAVDEGILARIIVAAGSENVAVGEVIALILEEGEDKASLDQLAPPSSPDKPLPSKPLPIIPAKPLPPLPSQPAFLKDDKSAPPQLAMTEPLQEKGARLFASPLAQRLAAEKQIDLQTVTGSGPHGRIIKMDIEKVLETQAFPPSSVIPASEYYADQPLTSMRKVIARRLTESKQQIPHFYITVDCCLDSLLGLRSQINSGLDGEKISVNDFIIRASALSLTKVPEANVSWQEQSLRFYNSADIAVAVAIPSGLVTPILRSAQSKTLRQLSTEMKTLAEKARTGRLSPEEFQGGSFTISNLGMYGIKSFNAIINPPQACILAVGVAEQRPVVRDSQIQIATQITCTLSVDHRAIDGAVASKFLTAFKHYMENPLSLLI